MLKVLITLGLLLTYFEVSFGNCPSKCSCNNKTNSITCINKGLQDVPVFETINMDSIIIIDLSGNSLESIDALDFSFEKNKHVVELYLNNSEINDIENQSFYELTDLQELYLGGNNLKNIPENIVINNVNLILLDISYNAFDELPILKSSSLEMLALAHSGISLVSSDSLIGLPNLRVLLLQENKLKELSPSVFNTQQNFLFVRVAYNNWYCDCNTVQLFDYLDQKKFIEITEPIQCMTEDKMFVDIYYSNGTTHEYKEKCKSQKINNLIGEDIKDFKEIKEVSRELEIIENAVAPNNDIVEDIINKNIDIPTMTLEAGFDEYGVDNANYNVEYCDESCYFSMKVVSFVSIVVSFIIGVTIGSYLTCTYNKIYMPIPLTESNKQLLTLYGQRV